MKNKRNVLIAFVLICCLCLSIGYAALAEDLKITGTSTFDVADNGSADKKFGDSVGFTKVVLDGATTTLDGGAAWIVKSGDEVIDDSGVPYEYLNEVSFSVSGFSKVGDQVVLVYTISNKHPDLNAKISLKEDGLKKSNEAYFEVTQEIIDATAEKNNGTADGTATVKVTVELKAATVTEQIANITVTYNAAAEVPTT